MKSQPFGFTMAVAFATLSLLISILCIDIIDICHKYQGYSTKMQAETSKIATSIELPFEKDDKEVIIDSKDALNSIAAGEIILGTTEEIAVEHENIKKDALDKALEAEKARQVYDGLTLEELTSKINTMFKGSYLKNTGNLFASYSLEKGVDTYTVVAIVLLETGCSYKCSTQVKTCNNVGGIKGGPSCNGTSYKKFDTLEEGIKKFIDILSDNYYKKGLDTPEKINTKYATSKTWANKVNKYIDKIRKA